MSAATTVAGSVSLPRGGKATLKARSVSKLVTSSGATPSATAMARTPNS